MSILSKTAEFFGNHKKFLSIVAVVSFVSWFIYDERFNVEYKQMTLAEVEEVCAKWSGQVSWPEKFLVESVVCNASLKLCGDLIYKRQVMQDTCTGKPISAELLSKWIGRYRRS